MTTQSPGRQFYEEQLAYLRARDVVSLLKQHYHSNAVLINMNGAIRGHAALRPFFERYLDALGEFHAEIIGFVETDEGILWEATMDSNFGQTRVYDALAIRDGKITHHFAGVMTT